jgi:hypothetical protein
MKKDKKETCPSWPAAWCCDDTIIGRVNRQGKIGRLPLSIREELNHGLQDGERGARLVRWLNGLPETRTALARDPGERKVTLQNLVEWKRGGFRDWQAKQDTQTKIAQECRDWVRQQPVQHKVFGHRKSYFEKRNEIRRILGMEPLTRKDIPPGEDWDTIPPRPTRRNRREIINAILRTDEPDEKLDEDEGNSSTKDELPRRNAEITKE